MATSQQIHSVIVAVESGEVVRASKEQLAEYAAWLSHPTSPGYCSAQQYQQVCETVRFYLGQTMDSKQTINVTGSSNFQIGDGNTQTINQGIALKREIIENLRPSSLTNLGLAAALEIQLREFTERSGILVISDLAAITASEDVQITIYRVVQESLTNIVKYASASEIRVSMRTEGARVWITVGDNG